MKKLKAYRILFVSLVGILCFNFEFVHSDISDDECGTIKEVAATTENPLKENLRNKTKLISQKSLLIIFDNTNSMMDDLIQLRSAAKKIVVHYSARKEKPIKNYVLSVFNDPSMNFHFIFGTHIYLFSALCPLYMSLCRPSVVRLLDNF
jgi:hypothetical protein